MNLPEYSLRNGRVIGFFLLVLLVGGAVGFTTLGKKEDSTFVIKSATLLCSYPGATPEEVESLITEPIEREVQSMRRVHKITSESWYGRSKIQVELDPATPASQIPQLWDELRRKTLNVTPRLPEGASPITVADDFGDVYGIYYGLSADEGFAWSELRDWAERLKVSLVTVEGVQKVTLYGEQTPVVDVYVSLSTLANFSIRPETIVATIRQQNTIVNSGEKRAGELRVRLLEDGTYRTLDDLSDQLLISSSGKQYRLGDIAHIERGYSEPPQALMRVDGRRAVGIGISTEEGVDVVKTGAKIDAVLSALTSQMPVGLELTVLYPEDRIARDANRTFVLNLAESVAIVVLIIMLVMGFRSGLVIGSSLLFSIGGTLLLMQLLGEGLNRTSLAGFIIAMGMLVDNAIVVYDAALVNMQRGMRKRNAILSAVSSTAMPLLGATLIAILAFLLVYLSPHITCELLSTLFIVIAVSLSLSWILAISQNVFFVQEFVHRPRPEELKGQLFQGKIYQLFRKMLRGIIHRKYALIGVLAGLLILSAIGFKHIPQRFTPLLNKQYFSVDVWLPEGTRIEETEKQMARLAKCLSQKDGVRQVSTFTGQTPPRFYLANSAYGPQPNYAQCLVEATSPEISRQLQHGLQSEVASLIPDGIVRVNSFEINSIPQALIEARFCGKDPAVLDSLTRIALGIMRENPKVMNARNEWGNMAMNLHAGYDPIKAGSLNIGRSDMMTAVKSINDGTPIGIYRDYDKKVPVLLHTPGYDQWGSHTLKDLTIWNGENSAPLGQITSSLETEWEFPLVHTYNRQLSMAAQCDVQPGHTMKEVHDEIRDKIEAIQLPEGYSFFWDSQYKDQKESMAALTKFFPLSFVLLILILIGLFGNYRQPLIILLMLPLSLIGMVVGLLVTGFDFGFFCIAGWLGLLGMIIKNVIVLLDETNHLLKTGMQPADAIVEATVSRTRPVLMAALTTVFGSVPLLFDIVFGGMAATIVFGLSFATLLTLFVTPALYAIFYKIKI